jgi:hypothetical protein
MTLFGQYVLFTSNLEAMDFFEFHKHYLQGKGRKIESTPIALIKHLAQTDPEQFKVLSPFTFGYMIKG